MPVTVELSPSELTGYCELCTDAVSQSYGNCCDSIDSWEPARIVLSEVTETCCDTGALSCEGCCDGIEFSESCCDDHSSLAAIEISE